MQPVRAALPELVLAGSDALAAPVGRPRNLAPAEALRGFGPLRFEYAPIRYDLALVRRPGADAAPLGPGPVVGVGIGVADRLDAAAHPDQALQLAPPETERGLRGNGPILALAAAGVRKEHHAVLVEAFQQHDARRGRAVPPGGGKGHCAGLEQPG